MHDKVIKGKDDYLFLGQTPHQYNEIIQGIVEKSDESLITFRNNIKTRAKYCKERDIKYKHFVFPEKTNVLSSSYPYEISATVMEKARKYFPEDVVDLSPVLRSINFPYLRTDTHLSFDGELASSLEILNYFFKYNYGEVKKIFESFKAEGIETICDLGGKLNPQVKEIRYQKKTPFLERHHNRSGVNDGLFIICLHKSKLQNREIKRLLIFGDSFMEFNLQFLSYFYSEILFCRTRFFHEEIVEMYKPDHVITENVERYLYSIAPDDEAPRFNLLYGLREVQGPSNKLLYEVYNAELSFEKKPYYDFLNKYYNNNKKINKN